ncbi:Uncharacterized protein OBRU01_07415, partial [Operophtera brumata]
MTAAPVESCTVSCVELSGSQVWLVSAARAQLPLQVEDAARPEKNNSSAFLAQSPQLYKQMAIAADFDKSSAFLAQSPQLYKQIAIAADFDKVRVRRALVPSWSLFRSGSVYVFTVSYFKSSAFLAQSLQLYKQMAIAADFDKSPQLYKQMAIAADFDKSSWVWISRCRSSTTTTRSWTPSRRHSPISSGDFATRVTIGEEDDLSTPDEKLLGRLVKAKYDTDFYILDKYPLAVRPFYTMPDPNNPVRDKYPLAVRPFYTMPDPNNPKASNSYDMFMRGEEILSGAQRIHDPDYLTERAKHHAIDNIRKTSMFPRDPKRVTP